MQLLFTGHDLVQLDRKIESELSKLKISQENKVVFDGSQTDFNFDDFYYELISESLLGDDKLILLKNPLFLSSKQSLQPNQAEMLMKVIQQPSPTVSLVISCCDMSLDSKKNLVKTLHKHFKKYELEEVGVNGFSEKINKFLNHAQHNFTPADIEYILSMIKTESAMQQFLEKLQLLPLPYDFSLVKLLIIEENDAVLFDLSNAIIEQKTVEMFKTYYKLKNSKVDTIAIIYILANKLRQLYTCCLLKNSGYTQDEIAKELKISSKFVWFLLNRQALTYSVSQCLKTLNELYNLDYQIKNSLVDKDLGFELWLIQQGEKYGKFKGTI